ncbi:hypothetical protein I542_0343 [Mycobacteroides abscessus 1948]|uniref:Uncharacterized protein n=1 Tax=Mycobacteroides abscessus 1948 TaxID=1299323 RepID=A0A829QCB0_9MYCO|nr:hypothetical protein I542_0343 [Mycobacteroides abscessus 1948]
MVVSSMGVSSTMWGSGDSELARRPSADLDQLLGRGATGDGLIPVDDLLVSAASSLRSQHVAGCQHQQNPNHEPSTN